MSKPYLFSIIESPLHPNFAALYAELGFEEQRFTAMRKAISVLKKQKPSVVVAEFFYGYSNNYAGVNISNLDVFLMSLKRYAPDTKVIVFVEKKEHQYVDPLNDIMPLAAILQQPVNPEEMRKILGRL